jgi:hypothetical protein
MQFLHPSRRGKFILVSNIIDTDFKPSEIATYPNLIHSLEGFKNFEQ